MAKSSKSKKTESGTKVPRSTTEVPRRAARWVSFAAFLLALFCYVSLWRHSNFHILVVQALMWGLALWNRRWPLYALALAFPFFGDQPGAPYALYFVDMTLWFVVGRWLLARWRAGAPPIVYTPLNPWIALGWVVAVVSLLPHAGGILAHLGNEGSVTHRVFATYQTIAFVPLWPLHALLDLTLSLLFFFYLLDQWRGRKVRARLLRNLWIALAASMVFGLLDFFGILSLEWFRPPNPEILKFGSARLQSFFWHSGWYAEWMALLAPVSLAFALCPGRRIGPWRRAGGLVFSLLAGWVTLLTYQRGGWLALAAGYGVVAVLSAGLHLRTEGGRRVAIRIVAAFAIAAALCVAALVVLAHRGDTALGRRLREIGALRDRTQIWKSALVLSARYPMLGVGIGRFHEAHCAEFPEGHPFWIVEKGEAHNTYLHVLAERGVPGLVLLLGMLVAALVVYSRAWRQVSAHSSRAKWIVAGLGTMAAWMVYAVPQYMSYMRIVDLTFWTVLAFTLHAARRVAPSIVPLRDAALRDRDRKRRRALGAALDEVLRQSPAAKEPEGTKKTGGTNGDLSWEGLWWLASPFVWTIVLCLGLRHGFGQAVADSAPDGAKRLGAFAYACFVSAGYLPWLVVSGVVVDALRHPKMSVGGLTFLQVTRLQIALIWFCVFTGALAFLLGVPFDIGARDFIGLLALTLLVLNLGLLLARLARDFAGRRRLTAITARIVFALWFCATPVVYPYPALAGWAKALMMANPMLPPVRIAQKILYGQNLPSAGWWCGLIGWSALLAVVTMLTARHDGAGTRGRRSGAGLRERGDDSRPQC